MVPHLIEPEASGLVLDIVALGAAHEEVILAIAHGDVVEDRGAESPLEMAATALLPQEIIKLLGPLDEREREILRLRFGLDRGEPRTLEEVGEHFNLTRERIRQIEARAMSKLRHPSSDTGARDLLAV